MKENIIGREQEIEKLENYISSRKSEFEPSMADDV